MIRQDVPDSNIALELARVAESMGDEQGLVARQGDGCRSWTFREILDNSRLYGAALQSAGVKRGQRVMLMVRPSMEFVCLTYGLFMLGAVVILIDPGMGYRNLLRCVARVRPESLVAIPLVQVLSRIFPAAFRSVTTRITVGGAFGFPGRSLRRLAARVRKDDLVPFFAAGGDDPAAIIFTTGSTGPPKGVRYTHSIFHAQLQLIRDYYRIGPGEVDQPAFPLFALFSTALGAKAVIPEMNAARPAMVDPERFIRTIFDHQVTYSFGSPAIWNVVSRYCLARNIILPIKKILMAGAPVSGELVERVSRIMDPAGEIHTPYGATESLPIASITGREIMQETWQQTRGGAGVCVGRALPGITIRIIAPADGPISSWREAAVLSAGEIGEIVVKGPVVTREYDRNDQENRLAKIPDDGGFWHRMGDMGYLDGKERLWFCGRKAHRVLTGEGVMYTIPCEAVFNEHLDVRRSALVGVGRIGDQRPVIIVELIEGLKKNKTILGEELLQLARQNELTVPITTFLVHPGFPVDIRHNAKIFREKLALWAREQLDEFG